jgi:hypothetical protein
MLRYDEFISESLAAEVKSEPKTAASMEARRLGLTYMGFGRYANSKGEVAYVVDNGRLVPYKSRIEVQASYSKSLSPSQGFATFGAPKKKDETSFYAQTLNSREKEDKKITSVKEKEALKVNKELYNFYNAGMFDDNELSALGYYTADGYEYINRFLYMGHEPDMSDDEASQLENYVDNIDSAFENTEAPFDYTVYTGLSERYKPEKIKPGTDYIFRGYISTSLSYDVAISGFTEGNDAPVVLQIEVKKGQKSIYTDAISSNPGELEALLPRGSRVRVVSGPHQLDATVVSNKVSGVINLFHCELVEE